MNTLLDVPAPAKLNLFLHIVGRRPDGYHLMQSVFVLLDLCDWLDFELRNDPSVTREDCGTQVGDPLPTNDLVVRAAQLLQQTSGCTKGAHIRLRKNIPVQAGMGGGSSDAASCLLALNRLWETGLNRQELMDLGLKLGADVPFFLLGDNAWAEGVGDKLHPIDFPPQEFVTLKPSKGVATAAIFTDPSLKRDTEGATMRGFAECSDQAKVKFGRNDLQPVAQAQCPEISDCLAWLNSQGLTARMTGSGSAVFAPLLDKLPPPSAPSHWFMAQVKSLREHPLKNWVH
jgi:4-diphosphocytidyl-2-C-methyl-D-erythritol kinase